MSEIDYALESTIAQATVNLGQANSFVALHTSEVERWKDRVKELTEVIANGEAEKAAKAAVEATEVVEAPVVEETPVEAPEAPVEDAPVVEETPVEETPEETPAEEAPKPKAKATKKPAAK